ncbi:putative porin [uncultured Megamonas sp.]|uniref:putative porin n=1 Tax=uncultured Megamonas sp. TaxID=286140 RepID=UPI0025DEE76D|nr:putative porin [uncultured Megamonas sp.]
MSKKTLVSAITAALVIGAASTTFAASNPFSDVPADSWAYDAVTTLANDGVIDGYPDGTYQGQNTMTRYEMAQIVARAMAKTDLEKADKALVDKLAAEFAEELDNLGVRVADLEKKSDNVVWHGELRYRYVSATSDATDRMSNHTKRYNDNDTSQVMFRLEPKAYIGNTGWTANARIDYEMNARTDSNAKTVVARAYAKGPLGHNTTISAGRIPLLDTYGMLLDEHMSGAQIDITSGSDKNFTTSLLAGRYNPGHETDKLAGQSIEDITADFYAAQFNYKSKKFDANAMYAVMTNIEPGSTDWGTWAGQTVYDYDKMNIWSVGGLYRFDNNWGLLGQYAVNTESDNSDDKEAYMAELQYKNANVADPGSWGAYVAYRHFGKDVTIATTYKDVFNNQKGFAVGASYVPMENLLASVKYFDGKDIDSNTDADRFYFNLDFFY